MRIRKGGSEELAQLLEKVEAAVHQPMADLRIRAWRSAEPLRFEERRRGDPVSLQKGDVWGRDCFDCAWMSFQGHVPDAAFQAVENGGLLFVRIDVNGELCLYDKLGRAVVGLTNKSSTFDVELGSPAKQYAPLDAPFLQGHEVEIWADAAFNDLFGKVKGDGRIENAEIVVRRPDLFGLFHDLELCLDLLHNEKTSNDFLAKAKELSRRASEWLEDGENLSADAVERVRSALLPLFSADPDPSIRISAIGHAHLDLAWLWPIRETKRKGIRTFATALENLDRYENYRFGCSQPQLFAWLENEEPELFRRIRSAVQSDRIELLGTFWVEPDCNVPSGESLVRQILHGRRYFQSRFDCVPKQCWQPDVFGYNGQLPQILKRSGHDAFMTQKLSWNSTNRFPHHSFNWQGIDGSILPAHNLPEETYNGPASAKSMIKIRDHYAEKSVSDHALMVFGIGDGGGGPGEAHLERLKRLRSFGGLPSVQIESSAGFFEEWLSQKEAFPSWEGELYLERHQGTYTTIAAAKRFNRLCETALRECEALSVFAEAWGALEYPSEELDAIWKEVLLYQFHDVLPGSSIKRVYDECLPHYRILLDAVQKLTDDAVEALVERMGIEDRTVLFNSLNGSRRVAGRDGGSTVVPGFGWSVADDFAENEIEESNGTADCLENDRIRVEFDEEGAIRSLQTKEEGRELIPSGKPANLFEIRSDEGDAWDFAADHWKIRPVVPRLVESRAVVKGSSREIHQVFRHGNSEIGLQISLESESEVLTFSADVNWSEPRSSLRVVFPTVIESDTARFEIPYGSIRRPAHERDSHAQAQFEVPAQQWVDLSDEEGGLALLNDCKYGFRVKDGQIAMSLIRSVPYPNVALIGAGDQSDTGPSAEGGESTQCSDLGKHVFRYALFPYTGRAREGRITRLARELNQPVRIYRGTRGADGKDVRPEILSSGTFLQVDSESVEVVALKKAEDGCGVILRLVNLAPEPVSTKISLGFAFSGVREVDLVEEPVASATRSEGQSLMLQFRKFEIKTLHFPRWFELLHDSHI